MSSLDNKKIESKKYFEGLDILRAFFSVVVVGLHTELFNLLSSKKLNLANLVDIWNANLASFAVPVFLTISLFLFHVKSKGRSKSYLKQRLVRLLSLYIFWTTSKLIFDFVTIGKLEATKFEIFSVTKLMEFIISAGNTIFYFFFTLIFLTIANAILISFVKSFRGRSIKIIYYLLFSSCILVFCFPIVDLTIIHHELFSLIYNPLSFLPYTFVSFLIAHEFNEGKFSKMTPSLKWELWSLFSLYLLFVILEWKFFGNIANYSRYFPNYSRISLVAGSWLLTDIALLFNSKIPATLGFLSRCSLGIYVFHTFFIDHTKFLDPLSELIPGLSILIRFLVALIGSIVLTLLFKKIKYLRNFV